jgi:diguanylate cyclase (GGDEF)-like protein/PAS domain S-box-containing protein
MDDVAALPPQDDILVDHVHAGVCVIADGRFVYVNQCLADMLDHSVAEMLDGMDALRIVHPDDQATVLEKIRRRSAGEVTSPYDIRVVGRTGRTVHARVCGRFIHFRGEPANLVTLTDIDAVKQALDAAAQRARMLALTEDLCLGASLEFDLASGQAVASEGFRTLLGLPPGPADQSRRALLACVPDDDRHAVTSAWRHAVPGRPFELQHRMRRPDGSTRILHHRGLVEVDANGAPARGIAILRDVTQERDTERRLRELSSRDPVTGLPNRAGLIEAAEARLAAEGAAHARVTLLAIEIPQLTQVKQGLGYETSDALAMALAARLVAALPDGDTLARLSGGEFAVLVRDEADIDLGAVVSARARAIEGALAEPLAIRATRVFATCSIGAARSPDNGALAGPLLSSALNALRSASETGAGQVRLASSRGNEHAMRRIALEWALRHALPAGEFSLKYQPQLELRHGGICGVEALLRWHSSTLGHVSPAEFIPVAEQSGLIVRIGEWVLRTACAQAAAWKRDGLGHVRVHVNISAAQFARDDLAALVQAILLESGADPSQLGVEVTESLLTADTPNAARALGDLRAIGVEIALDDFGTGYSNLSTLRALPIDVIKIDRSYVHDVLAAPAEVSVTRAVINMAHSLQMRVLAEGVESESQLALLLAHRCDAIQGFYFSQAVEAHEIAALVREGRRLPAHLFDRPPSERTLLLVDDEDNILASLKRSLRRGGYRILTANGAAEGLQRLAENDVDVIVSDQRMPGMTGVEFLRRAKDLYPDTVRIVLSGYTELQSITDAINEGAIYKFLTKPWEDDLLRANIDEAFRRKGMADENRRLDQEVRTANAELAELNERLKSALARQNEELSVVADRGRNALEVLYKVPTPLIGFDTEGLVAFANHDAERLLPGIRGWLGSYVDETMPAGFQEVFSLRDGESLDLWLDGVSYRCNCRAIDDPGGRRGTLVAITRRDDAVPERQRSQEGRSHVD